MLYIHYNQTKPNQTAFEYAIQGNNNVDVVCFDIKEIELGFEPTHIYVKVQSKDKKYIDKIELTESNGVLNWHLLAKTTRHKVVSVQLSFETDTQYFQTEMVELTLKPYINAEEEIENDYPLVLQDLQRQIDEMSGGGGASSVEIEKIWLTYDDKKSIRTDVLGAYEQIDGGSRCFVNDSTRIWVNFETTPIGAKIENEIKNGRFVIRLDYPTKSRNIKLIYDNGGGILAHQPQNDYGVGARSYCYNFKKNIDTRNPKKNEILKRSLIFVNESDIKLNRYGEKYIHKKISLFQYITNICETNAIILYPITNEKIQEGQELFGFFNDYVDDTFQIGIPTLNQHGFDTPQPSFNGSFVYKCYSRRVGFVPNFDNNAYKVNGKKLNPAFTCYTPFYTKNSTSPVNLVSPYWNNHHNHIVYNRKQGSSVFYTMFSDLNGKEMLQNNSKRNYMVAKPRCAILNEDWENADYSFLKTFPQATQDIKLVCKAIRYIDDFGVDLMPIFRIKIGAK